MSCLFYYAYQGGKRGEIKYMTELLESDYKIMVEPFCGSCAVSLYNKIKNKKNIVYHVNDLESMHIKLLTDIKKDGSKKYFDFCTENWKDGITTKEEFKKIIENKDNNLFNYFYFKKIYNLRQGLYPSTGKKMAINYNKYLDTDEFFKDATITNKDFKEIFEQYKDNEDALLFLDPPYLNSCNVFYDVEINKKVSDENNNINDKTNMWMDIFNFMESCKCKVILIINKVAILDHIFKKYRYHEFNKQYSNTKSTEKTTKGYHKDSTKHIIYTNIK